MHVLAGNDGFPPRFVVQVPLDRLLDAVGKFRLRQPAELGVDSGGLDRVAVILVIEPVADVLARVQTWSSLLFPAPKRITGGKSAV